MILNTYLVLQYGLETTKMYCSVGSCAAWIFRTNVVTTLYLS